MVYILTKGITPLITLTSSGKPFKIAFNGDYTLNS